MDSNRAPESPMAAVLLRLAYLAEDVRKIDGREAGHWSQVHEQLRELSDQLVAVATTAATQQDMLGELAAVTAREIADNAGPEAWAPVWTGLTDEEYARQLAALRAWVDGYLREVYAPYTNGIILDCWVSHPTAIHELGDLWAEHERIYHHAKPSPTAALTWKGRWLGSTLARLPLVMGEECKAGNCPAQAVTDFRAALDTLGSQAGTTE
jgi:hypothetical protein